ncbi:hypothetical protein M8J77_024965 [Diaphorina citri]|nr:hypothetical protein M8J77_024965 [Diaphorina citri]
MAPPELKSEHLKMVPEFNGEVSLLPDFIAIADKLVAYFTDAENPNSFQNFFLLNSLKSKVTGEARLNISAFTINNWAELKAALLNSYSDKRDAYTLTIELCNLKQNFNETPFEFHQKVTKHINLHSSYLSTHNEVEGKNYVNTYINKLGLRTFLKGLKEPLGSLMRTRDVKDMNEALNLLTNEYQIDATKKATQNTQSQNYKHNNNNNNSKSYNQNNKSYNQNNNNNYNKQNNSPLPNFPFRPAPNFQKPSHFQQNTQFTPFQNRFNNTPQNTTQNNQHSKPPLPKPTPMSGVQTIKNSNYHNLETDQYGYTYGYPEGFDYSGNQTHDPSVEYQQSQDPHEPIYTDEPIQDFQLEASDTQEQEQ